MLLKEQGYDEFLAEKIRRGQEYVKAGRVFTAGNQGQEHRR